VPDRLRLLTLIPDFSRNSSDGPRMLFRPRGTIQTYAHQVLSAAELCHTAGADGACLSGIRERDPSQNVFASIEIGGPYLSRTRY
jgi:hypothetical protein